MLTLAMEGKLFMAPLEKDKIKVKRCKLTCP